MISDPKRKALIKLWFIWGNYGIRHSDEAHKFLQRLLESGEDLREFYKPPPALVEEVNQILAE